MQEIIGQVIFAVMMWLVGFMSGSYYGRKKAYKELSIEAQKKFRESDKKIYELIKGFVK